MANCLAGFEKKATGSGTKRSCSMYLNLEVLKYSVPSMLSEPSNGNFPNRVSQVCCLILDLRKSTAKRLFKMSTNIFEVASCRARSVTDAGVMTVKGDSDHDWGSYKGSVLKSEMFVPPPHPRPLLNADQVLHLARTGYLPLNLSPALRDCLLTLLKLGHEFFKESTSSKESQYPTAQGTELGYYLIENEKEYLTLRHHYGRDTTRALSLAASNFWTTAASFLYRILSDLSTALDIPTSVWDPLLDGCLSMPASLSETTPTLLRLFEYLPGAGSAEKHTDTGFLTLCIGTAPGLQVWSPLDSELQHSGTWSDVGNQPTVLVGRTLQWLSSSRLRAGLHRVVPNAEGRRSVVFALRPSLRHPKLDLAPFGTPSTVDLVDVWKHIRGNVFNVNAQSNIRKEQKRKLAANVHSTTHGLTGHGEAPAT
ncbi:MAG: hypothetical protein Q9171_001863 [Xanthocarpia ochracea]